MSKAYDDGCQAMEDFDYVLAVSLFDKARGLADELGDIQYAGFSNMHLGEIYLGIFSPSISIPYFDRAFDSFLQLQDTVSAIDALVHKGIALYQGGDIEGSRKILEEVDMQLNPGDRMEPEVKCALAMAYLSLSPPLPAEAAALFDYSSNFGEINSIEYLSAYAYALMLTGRKDESSLLFKSLQGMGASEFHPYLFWKALAAEAACDYDEAFNLLKASFTDLPYSL